MITQQYSYQSITNHKDLLNSKITINSTIPFKKIWSGDFWKCSQTSATLACIEFPIALPDRL